VLRQSEENRVLFKKGYWNVGMEEVQEQEMKVSRRIEGLAQLILVQRVSVLTNRYMSRSVNCVNYEAVLACRARPDRRCPEAAKPDRRRPEADAPSPTMPETFRRLTDAFQICLVGHYCKEFIIL